MPKPKSIDFRKSSFISNGNKYIIDPKSMCYDRMVEFLATIPTLTYGVNFADLNKHFIKHLQILSSGNDMAKNYVEAYNHALNFQSKLSQSNSEEFFNTYIDEYLRFCALFVNREDEDATTISEAIIQSKIEDWKRDMNIYDFFLLAKTQLPAYRELSQELSKGKVAESQ